MHTFRTASLSDLPIIYRMQNIPERERILNAPLPSYEEFLAKSSKNLGTTERYFVHEENGQLLGFIHYLQTQETCEPTIWGRWINTLVFAGARIAFDFLNVSKLNWSVRKANKRALRCYESFHIRKTGTGNICRIEPGFQFIAIGPIVLFELTEQEFRQREESMKRVALPVHFDLVRTLKC